MNENSGIPGSTSLSELRQSNSDPFSKLSRFKRFFTDDSFRSICLGFILSSLILSIALIFDANLGNGPIPQHGAVVSSSEICSEFGGKMLKKTRNSYDTAIAVSFCLAATNPEAVSFGGGLLATIYQLDQNSSQYIDYLGREASSSVPALFAGLSKLKETGDARWKDHTYKGSSFSEMEPEKKTMSVIASDVREFLNNDPTAATAKATDNVQRILKRIQQKTSAYDDWYGDDGEIKQKLVQRGINSSGLSQLKNIKFKSTLSSDLTNGRLQSRSPLPILVLGSIDEYIKLTAEKDEEDILTVKDERFPSLIASAMYETSLTDIKSTDSELKAQTAKIAQNIDDEKLGIRPRHDENFVSPFALTSEHKTAFLTVVGDDNEVISLVFTTGGSACEQSGRRPERLTLNDGTEIKICLSDFTGTDDSRFPSPVIFRPKCGSCGRHTIVNGELNAIVNLAAHTIRHASLFASTFVERVSVADNGTVLVEAGMPKLHPEMYKTLEKNDKSVDVMGGAAIGWAGAVEWKNDAIHAISDERIKESWPAYVF